MVKFWIIAGVICLILTLIIAKFTLKYYKKENSEKMWKLWGMKSMYWQGVVLVSGGLTFLIMLILKWSNILTF
jgi:TRAP-type C4-dicarboxylate transport system permease small subunit